MLFYSRNILISLRKWHKTLKLSVRMSGLANIESMAEAGILLYFYFLGSGSHLKDHRPMLNRRKKYCTQNLSNRSNLLNTELKQPRRRRQQNPTNLHI